MKLGDIYPLWKNELIISLVRKLLGLTDLYSIQPMSNSLFSIKCGNSFLVHLLELQRMAY